MGKIKNNKRIIAREILVFFGCVIIFCTLWIAIILKNSYYSNALSSLQFHEEQIHAQLALISIPNKKEVNWNSVPDEANSADTALYSRMQTTIKLNQLNNQKIITLSNELAKLQIEKNTTQSHVYNIWEIKDYLGICLLIIISIAYGLRYSVISIVWAIRVFRNESKSLSDNPEPMT